MAKYQGMDEVEKYIDLIPILENLYYDVETFLKPIKEVRIEYTWYKAVADKMDIIINGYVLHFYLNSLEC